MKDVAAREGCTPDLGRMEQALAGLSPADAGAFRKFLPHNRGKLARFRDCLERPSLGWADVFSWSLLKTPPG